MGDAVTAQPVSSAAETRPAQEAAGGAADIQRQALAAKNLRESIAQLMENGDDEELAVDMIEGETSLLECIDALLEANTQDAVIVAGVERVASDLSARKSRVAGRIQMRRALIEQAMLTAEIKKLERPAATLSLANRPASLIVADESAIPSRFWIAADPKLDRKALSAALKEGEAVTGAALSNAAPTLSVRVK